MQTLLGPGLGPHTEEIVEHGAPATPPNVKLQAGPPRRRTADVTMIGPYDVKRPVFRTKDGRRFPMLWPSRRFVVAALTLGAAQVLAQVVAAERPDPWKSIARYRLEYRVRLRELGPAAKDIALWVPYPAETRDQRVLEASIDSPWPKRLTREEKYGNRMVSPKARPTPPCETLSCGSSSSVIPRGGRRRA